MSKYRKVGLAVMIAGVTAGSIFVNMTYQSNYYYLADLNMDLTSIRNMNHTYMVYYAIYIVGKRFFQTLLFVIAAHLFVIEAIIVTAGFIGSFTFSAFLTYQIMQTGLNGVITIILAICPQWFFYGMGIWWSIRRAVNREKEGIFRFSFLLIILLLLGVLTEIFINPKLLLMQIS